MPLPFSIKESTKEGGTPKKQPRRHPNQIHNSTWPSKPSHSQKMSAAQPEGNDQNKRPCTRTRQRHCAKMGISQNGRNRSTPTEGLPQAPAQPTTVTTPRQQAPGPSGVWGRSQKIRRATRFAPSADTGPPTSPPGAIPTASARSASRRRGHRGSGGRPPEETHAIPVRALRGHTPPELVPPARSSQHSHVLPAGAGGIG